ncbi:hypothetical protein [Streptococcus suis]|uniref:hypothetical protein n=1 Tax=Streptococcus suis TaxID=1307 RepID=UPI000CF50CC8|nr:hypothetical protein [Streptococcus suis]
MATNLEILHLHHAASYYETMQERFEEGYEEGVEDGFEKGAEQKTQEVLTSLFQVGMSDEDISLVLKIPIEQVRMLRKDIVTEKSPKYGN